MDAITQRTGWGTGNIRAAAMPTASRVAWSNPMNRRENGFPVAREATGWSRPAPRPRLVRVRLKACTGHFLDVYKINQRRATGRSAALHPFNTFFRVWGPKFLSLGLGLWGLGSGVRG
jgi:hypothetical protein